MKESIGFRLPKTSFNTEFIWIGFAMATGLLMPWLLGLGFASIETIGLAAILWSGSYWYMTKHEWIYLSTYGIQGQSLSGAKVFIPWSASVALESHSAFGGIKCISIKDANQKHELLLPVAISETHEFTEALEMVAPEKHPLLFTKDYLSFKA
jgi:hypothetical protein